MSPPSYERTFKDVDSEVNLHDNRTDDEEEIFQKGDGDEGWNRLEEMPKVGTMRNFTDCSNVFKAFIGSALIGLPFAVLQAGIGLSIVCIILIATATDHCCGLIVKCKRIVIKKMLEEKKDKGASANELKNEEEILGRTLSFGRIGKACLGRKGILAVNISVMVTQFGFTTGYFIFLGNTLRSVIKYFVIKPMHNITNTSIPVTPTHKFTPTLLTTTLATVTTNASNFVTSTVQLEAPSNHTLLQTLQRHLHHVIQKTVSEPLSPKNIYANTYAAFGVLLLFPLPILIGISFIRKLRKLGPISVIANVSITSAFACTLVYIITTMKGLPKHIYWARAATFPVFFGQVTGAYEGIGTVIPIEGSMAENRHRYPCFLHISLFLVSLILGSFGIIGYLAFGDKTCQIVTNNDQLSGPVGIALQMLLFIGVLFTYPLQIYPCIQITERVVIKYKQWVVRNDSVNDLTKEEEQSLMDGDEKPLDIKKTIKIKRWEGNLIRIILVSLTACIALFFRSQFAYIAALTGSIGSSLLSFILPCIFHIKLSGPHLPRLIFIKNIVLILFGVCGGIMGFTVTVKEIVDSFGSKHPAHC